MTGLALTQVVKLNVNADLAQLLPEDYESVRALNRLKDTVGAESTVDVAIRSPSFDANKAFAEAIIPKALALRQGDGTPVFTRVDYRRDVSFIERNALYFATNEELDRLESFLRQKSREVRAANDPLRVDLLRPETDSSRRAQEESLSRLRGDLESLNLGEYLASPDSTTLAIRLYPSGSQADLGYVEDTYLAMDSLVIAMQAGRFHPEMVVTNAGRLLRQSVEVRAITEDVSRSFGAGVFAVLLTVALYFLYKTTQTRTGGRFVLRVLLSEILRTPVTALLLATPLLMALSWAGAVAAITFGTLNLMTSTLGLVLFGLGIDYGIHFYARYTEERKAGRDAADAAEETFASTGQAVAVSAMTTASALFVLMIADFRGFSEFGLIGGIGIIFALVAMLIVLPALLSLAERFRILDLRIQGEASTYEPDRRFPFSRTILGVCLAIVAVALLLLPRVRFEYDFSKLSPTYPEYDERAEAVAPVFSGSSRSNPAYILVDEADDVRRVTEALSDLAGRDSLILAVESLQERLPTQPQGIGAKLESLRELRTVLDDPFLAADTTGQVARLRRAASATQGIPLDSVPDFLTRPFTSKTGEIGNFVVVFPSGSLSDGLRSLRFAELVGEVRTEEGKTFYAASTQLVAADMLRLMQEESPRMVGITFLLVFLFVWLTFRSLKWSLVAMAPLAVGILWMLGTMVISGVTLTFYNLVVLPTVLGIGNDGGVHIAHRYREEGKGSIRRVLRSTGEHVTMGALTNLIGFGGLLLSSHPGLRSIGLLAVVGIGATMAATLVFFPALLQVLEDLRWLEPRRRRRRYELPEFKVRRPTFKLRWRPGGQPEAE
ncbi:transporter [Rubricoccus marinus]|uniref:Transporter n=2 Tax=Rubricoccus marinus TaxID=716817 RepID=A0A259U316_9BACT|nr:transporter [Rubricoccus marinus]